jgi:hypothetical protein
MRPPPVRAFAVAETRPRRLHDKEDQMTEPRTIIQDYDCDAQGNCVVWDHGGDGDPVPVTMHRSAAAHALAVDPTRYKLEPTGHGIEAEVDAEVAAIQKARAEAAKRAANVADALQRGKDYVAAAATVAARRRAAAAAAGANGGAAQ